MNSVSRRYVPRSALLGVFVPVKQLTVAALPLAAVALLALDVLRSARRFGPVALALFAKLERRRMRNLLQDLIASNRVRSVNPLVYFGSSAIFRTIFPRV